jgi:uncharacterized membrane protein YsdA (DUF1294 family)
MKTAMKLFLSLFLASLGCFALMLFTDHIGADSASRVLFTILLVIVISGGGVVVYMIFSNGAEIVRKFRSSKKSKGRVQGT